MKNRKRTTQRTRSDLMIREFAKRCVAVSAAIALIGAGPLPSLWAAQTTTLEGIEVGPDEVTVHLSKRAEYEARTLDNPPRLVINIPDTEHSGPSQYLPGDGKALTRVRSGQFQSEPLVSRVVLYMRQLVAYAAKWDGPRLKIKLLTYGMKDEPAAAAAPVPAPEPEPVVVKKPAPAPE
ncbi:AMIN domain-containing protein, partial [Elusimicrobiota bacterium]